MCLVYCFYSLCERALKLMDVLDKQLSHLAFVILGHQDPAYGKLARVVSALSILLILQTTVKGAHICYANTVNGTSQAPHQVLHDP
jgi:hypothetical protein